MRHSETERNQVADGLANTLALITFACLLWLFSIVLL